MANLITVRLQRGEGQPWGFRLQGGKDFSSPLVLQRVNGGSVADQAGLMPGDALVKVNSTDVYNLRHKEAQDVIMAAGNSFELSVSRGTAWRPSVTPTGSIPSPSPSLAGHITPVTKTSLAATPQPVQHIGSGHNQAAKPFLTQQPQEQLNGGEGPIKSIVNKQYNTPVAMYSDETIAETLSSQAEVLAGGVLGVNFKKNERVYSPANSEVYKLLHEQGDDPEPAHHQHQQQQHHQQSQQQVQHHHQQQQPQQQQQQQQYHQQHQQQQQLQQTTNVVTKHVSAPVDKPPAATNGLPAGQNICSSCDRLIVGVFVRIKDKNLHADCFKCATCGSSLKNQGYFNLNDKLYCDIHARLAALQSPPPGTNGMVPVTITKPGQKSGVQAISAALNAHANLNGRSQSPYATNNQSNIVPKPFGAPLPTSNLAQVQLPSSFPPVAGSVPTPFAAAITGHAPAPAPVAAAPAAQPAVYPPVVAPAPVPVVAAPTAVPTQQGSGAFNKGRAACSTTAPTRGRGIMNQAVAPGGRVPLCGCCSQQIRGPFITALGRIWCPDHFICHNGNCKRPLADIGFVEEKGDLYCEYCFEEFLAPVCSKCNTRVKGDCLNAIGKQFHPECFKCAYCGKLFGNSPFFLEEGDPYCEADWNELFTTKCFACGFPVEAGDKWVEALNNNYHSQCFNCTSCKKNLEGQSFFAKGGRPFCKNHAR